MNINLLHFQLKRFLQGELESLCKFPLLERVIIPIPLEESYHLGMSAICYDANYTAINKELSDLVDFQRIQRVVSPLHLRFWTSFSKFLAVWTYLIIFAWKSDYSS